MKRTETWHQSIAGVLLITLLAAMPIGIMTGNSAPSMVYYASIAVSLWLLFTVKPNARQLLSTYSGLTVAMALPVVVVLFGALWNGFLSDGDLETGSRFLLGTILIVAALQVVPRHQLGFVIWGYALAGLAATIHIIYVSWPHWTRPETSVYNAVIYGNMVFMIAMVMFLSSATTITRWPRVEIVAKLTVAALIFLGFFLTQTRTSWLALPACALVAAVLFAKTTDWRRIFILAITLIAVGVAAYASSDALRGRAALAVKEVAQCQGEGSLTESSLCVRLQLWRASWQMAKDRPIAGTGSRELFTQTMHEESLPAGIVTPLVAKWFEPHSDLMLALASFGFPGGLAMLLVYLYPAWLFARRLSFQHPAAVRSAAAIGLAICITFIVAGFGDTMFRSMRVASFYAMSLAVFLRLSEPSI